MEAATRRKILPNGTDHSIAIGGSSLPHQIKEVLQNTLSKLHQYKEV